MFDVAIRIEDETNSPAASNRRGSPKRTALDCPIRSNRFRVVLYISDLN